MGATQSKSSEYVLRTKKGDLRGIEQKDLNGKAILRRYTKIPYALPPTKDLRFRRPQPLPANYSFSSSSGPGDFSSFGPICPQPVYNTGAALVDNPKAAPDIENVQSEDCLYLNIWVPAGDAPASGWPVQVFIHGGWLQIGDANQSNTYDPFDLLASSTPRIIVAPTYRLNIFGFLAGQELLDAEPSEPCGNYGLWDQRAALEWTHANIELFSGNKDLISVGGLSAGSHSAFLQLYYDTYQPDEKRVIKQVYQWSNAIAIQPNPSTSEVLTKQWQELCEVLDVKGSNAKEKLAGLRAVSAEAIVAAIPKLKMHTFRTSTDNNFVPKNFLKSIHDGSFTNLLADHGVRIMLGEVCDEALLYKLVNPPSNYSQLVTQIENYYPKPVVEKLLTLTNVYDIPAKDEVGAEERYKDAFARIVADMQVHAAVRGLTKSLLAPPQNPTKVPEVLRYRISWRAKGLDDWLLKEVGVCHAGDMPVWWLSGRRAGYDESDKKAVDEFLKPFGEFLEGKSWTSGVGKGLEGARRIGRHFTKDGTTKEDVSDELWDKAMIVWNAAAEVQGVEV